MPSGKTKTESTITHAGFDLLHGFAARIGVAANERQMIHLAQEGADERHLVNFAFGDEAIRNAEAHHERKHVEDSWCDLKRRFLRPAYS